MLVWWVLKRISKDVVGLVTYKAYRQVWPVTDRHSPLQPLRRSREAGAKGHPREPGRPQLGCPLDPLALKGYCRCARVKSGVRNSSLRISSAGGPSWHRAGPPTRHGLTGERNRRCCCLSTQPDKKADIEISSAVKSYNPCSFFYRFPLNSRGFPPKKSGLFF